MELIARVIFVAVFAAVGYCVYRAVTESPRWFWAAAALLYLLAFPAAMSIGGWIVSGAFAFAGAALGSALPIRGRRGALAGMAAGIAVWALWVSLGDITWVFYPPLIIVDAIAGID